MNRERKPRSVDHPDMLEGNDNILSSEEINLKVQQAQQELLELKRKHDEIEQRKRELEELSRRQSEYKDGRRDILEKLTRGLVIVEREEISIKREAEQIQLIREAFQEQLKSIQDINSEDWEPRQLSDELTRALAKIDQASAVYSQSRARLEAMRHMSAESDEMLDSAEDPSNPTQASFGSLVRIGFAYSLPLIVVAVILVVVLLVRH